MAGRKIRDREDALACIEAQASSGLSLGQWTQQNGIDGRSLHAWMINMAPRSKPPAELRVVEVLSPTLIDSACPIRIRCGRFVVEVDSGFDDDALTRVLAAVASC